MDWTLKVLDDNGEVVNTVKANDSGVIPEAEEPTPPVEPTLEEPTPPVEPTLEEPTPPVEPTEEVAPNEALVEAAKKLEEEKQQLDDDTIMSYLKERYGLEAESLEDVLKKDEKLPEDVEKFLQYKQETGRGFQDFLNLQKDWESVDDSSVLAQYYKEKKPHLSDEDIKFLLEDKFTYDEEIDEDRDVKKKQVAYKDELFEARSYFEGLKEKFKAPLESGSVEIPEDYKEAYNFLSDYKQKEQSEQELQQQRSEAFKTKTEQLFNEEFKGFEFDLGEKKQAFVPKDIGKVKEFQSDISNFFAEHLDENGIIKDAASYHRAIFAASNADAMARYFYEQGKADATDGIVKKTKNIDMSVREQKELEQKGLKFRAVNDSGDFKLKFK